MYSKDLKIDNQYKTNRMKNSIKPLQVGDIVKYKPGIGPENSYVRIKSIRGRFCNVCGIFSGEIIRKSVLLDYLEGAAAEWYSAWSKTESYQCM